MSDIEPRDGITIQSEYVSVTFQAGFTLPEGIMRFDVDRRRFGSKDGPDNHVLTITVEAATSEAARERVLELRRAIVEAVKVDE